MAERTKRYRGSAAEERLAQAAWHILALAKLRMYPSAAEELAALGPLDAPQHEGEAAQGCISSSCMHACMHACMARMKEGPA